MPEGRLASYAALAGIVLLLAPAIGSASATPASSPAPSPGATAQADEGGPLDIEVALGPNGTVYVLASHATDREDTVETQATDAAQRPRLWVSHDGGRSYVPLEPASTQGLRSTPSGPEAGLAVDEQGRVFLAQRTYEGLAVSTSTDQGDRWAAHRLWPIPLTDDDRLAVDAAGGRVGVGYASWEGPSEDDAWTNARDRDPRIQVVTAGAASDPSEASHEIHVVERGPAFFGIAVGPQGATYLVQPVPGTGLEVVRIDPPTQFVSYSEGEAWPTSIVPGADFDRGFGSPAIAVGDHGSVLVAWTEQAPEGPSIELARSFDRGETWTDPVQLDPLGSCRAELALEARGGRAVLAHGGGTCGRPRAYVVDTDPRAEAPAVSLTWIDGPELAADPCNRGVVCRDGPDGTHPGIDVGSDGDAVLAWSTGGWRVETAWTSPQKANQRPAAAAQAPSQAPPGAQDGSSSTGWQTVSAGLGLAAGLWLVLRRRIRWLLLALYTRLRDKDVLDNELRGRIREMVAGEPGVHFRALAGRLDVSHGTLEHHVRKLREAGVLAERRLGAYRCFFLPGQVPLDPERVLPATKARGARAILEALGEAPADGLRKLADRTGLAPSTVSHHVAKLSRGGLVATDEEGQSMGIRLTERGERIRP